MLQWGHLPSPIRNYILSYIPDDTWRDQRLSSVCRNWQLIMPENHLRRQGGTIVLRAPTDNFSVLYKARGLTIATLNQLAFHSMRFGILPNHYDCVEIQPNIHEYLRIKNPAHQFELESILLARRRIPGHPLAYNNVTTLDCHDCTNNNVTENWESTEMSLVDRFMPATPSNRYMVYHTFVSHLLARFFLNVTSLNLSATKWTNQAEHSIPWTMLQKLIWNKCLCFDLLLPHLSTAENLLELQLDYSTL